MRKTCPPGWFVVVIDSSIYIHMSMYSVIHLYSFIKICHFSQLAFKMPIRQSVLILAPEEALSLELESYL